MDSPAQEPWLEFAEPFLLQVRKQGEWRACRRFHLLLGAKQNWFAALHTASDMVRRHQASESHLRLIDANGTVIVGPSLGNSECSDYSSDTIVTALRRIMADAPDRDTGLVRQDRWLRSGGDSKIRHRGKPVFSKAERRYWKREANEPAGEVVA